MKGTIPHPLSLVETPKGHSFLNSRSFCNEVMVLSVKFFSDVINYYIKLGT